MGRNYVPPEFCLQEIIKVLNLVREGADLAMIKMVIDYEDLDRVRECSRSDCKRVFFAKQKHSKYCSERCRGTDANRLLRSRRRVARSMNA